MGTGDSEMSKELVLELMAWMTTQLGGVVLSSTTVIRCCAPLLSYSVDYDCAVPQPSPTRMACLTSSFLGTEPCKDPMMSR